MSQRLNPLILALIAAEPMDVAEIATALAVSRQPASVAVKSIHEAGKVHIARREGIQQKAFYVAGPGEDAPRKKTLRDMIPEMIDGQAMTSTEIAHTLGKSRQVVSAIISQLRETGVKIRILDWQISAHGPHLARYVIGDGPDAERPVPLTNAEKIARYRATDKGKKTAKRCARRWRKSQAGREYIRKHSEKRWVQKKFARCGIVGFDPLLAAIMGVRA